MASIIISEPVSPNNCRATSSPQLSPSMLSKNVFTTKSRPVALSPEFLKPMHLSELAMPSPISTPGTEHMSDVSSCCSVDDTDSNRSSPPDSPMNSLTNSFSTPASDMKRKYKKELWSAIRSNYRYLMDEEIMDTCKSTESDLSFESDDQTTSVDVVSFKDFMQQFTELNSWLGSMLQKAQKQCNCRSEKYVHQAFHEDMLNHLMSLKHFKEYARRLIVSHPRLRDDINQHLKQVNGMWEALEKLFMPSANHSNQNKMLHEMELDFDGLRQWVDEMEFKRRTWRLHSHWTNDDIDRHLEIQRVLQAQIESHSRVVSVLLSLCDRLTVSRDDAEAVRSTEEQSRVGQLKEQVTDLQEELHCIWLNSLEWQMTMEQAKKNGIHVRHDAEDDQWDRMRSTGQRRQTSNLETVNELSSDVVSDEDSFFRNRSLHERISETETASDVKEYDADNLPLSKRLSDVDADDHGLSGNFSLLAPVESNSRSYSDPLLIGDSCDGGLRIGSGKNSGWRSNLKADRDPEIPTDVIGNGEDDVCREWSPGQLRRFEAIDLRAAFCGEKKDILVDVGYSSGSHSNEETDSSARQEPFIWPQNREPNGSDRDSSIYMNKMTARENTSMSVTGHCGNGKMGVGEISNSSAGAFTCDGRCLEAADEPSLPETEDEMSVELPLDDVPVLCSSDLCAEDICGPSPKKSLTRKTTALRQNLHLAEESNDFDSWPQRKVFSPKVLKKKQGKGKLENDSETSLNEKINSERNINAKSQSGSIPLSGSCYASSEGTESESDFSNQNLPTEKQERRFGRRLKSRWNGSLSLRSSPVKEVVECPGFHSPLKRRMSECKENLFGDLYGMEMSRQWMSDGAITEFLKEDSISPNKIPKMSLKQSDFFKSRSMNAIHISSKRLPKRSKNGNRDVLWKFKASDHEMQTDSFTEPAECLLKHSLDDLSAFLGCEADAVVPDCDSFNSSLTELTSDDFQMYSSDYEKIIGEEMQWHNDDYHVDDFEGDVRKIVKGHNVARKLAWQERQWMDSDSDREDFQHVLDESRKGLKFIEATICQSDCFDETDVCGQDPATFTESLATCKTNIICLQELIDALRSKNKMDSEILQVNEMVTRWQQLQSALLVLQKEAQQVFELQTEVTGIQMELQNMNATVMYDEKFCEINQLEEAVKAIKAVQFELNGKMALRLHTLDNAFRQRLSDRGDLDSQLFALSDQTEQLKKYQSSILKRCEANEHKLQSALIHWYKFNSMEKELNSLLQLCDRSSEDHVAGAGLDDAGDLEAMTTKWKLLDEKLQQLNLFYLDFVSVCSDSSAQELKQTITSSSKQLQMLRQTNDEKLMKLLKARFGSPFPETIGHQMASTNSQLLANGVVGNVSPVNPTVRPVNYVLPLTLAFVFISCLYALFGDSWFELLGSVGLILDPNLKHLRGPPPS